MMLPRLRNARAYFRTSLTTAIVLGIPTGIISFISSDTSMADSEFVLEPIASPNHVIATTFDEEGQEVGRSFMDLQTTAEGAHHMRIELSVTDGGSNQSQATLETVSEANGEEKLRLVEQRSQATGSDGVALDLLVIDHREQRATCYSDAKDDQPAVARHIDLPAKDHVVNVPLHLLFRPLALGKVDRIKFQIAICRSGPSLQDMIAVRGPRTRRAGQDVIEIRYGPDFGAAIAFIASRLLPKLSFWFGDGEGRYLGHRMPLYRSGPDVLLIRQGMEPLDLGISVR